MSRTVTALDAPSPRARRRPYIAPASAGPRPTTDERLEAIERQAAETAAEMVALHERLDGIAVTLVALATALGVKPSPTTQQEARPAHGA